MSKFDFKHVSLHGVPDDSPGYLLWRVSTKWRSAIEKVLKAFGLTHPQFVILASLAWLTRDGNKVSQADVGKVAGLDPNTTSQILRGLEVKKLIKRVQSIDERSKNPTLTAAASKLLAKALPAVEKEDIVFFDSLKSREVENLLRYFQKLS